MLDPWFIKRIKNPLHLLAKMAHSRGYSANQVTVTGFVIGMCVIPLLAFQHYWLALAVILINRILDGVDGAIARIQGTTDAGGFLDICLDFLFYSAVPFGFVLAEPSINAVAGVLLIFSFIGTGSSFLAFASIAAKRKLSDPTYQHKSLYYLTGLTEGSETIICFVLLCLFPSNFTQIASVFASLCFITTITRIYNGYHILK